MLKPNGHAGEGSELRNDFEKVHRITPKINSRPWKSNVPKNEVPGTRTTSSLTYCLFCLMHDNFREVNRF